MNRFQIVKSLLQPVKVLRCSEDEQVGVPAKFRSAVEHAGLAAYQQGANPACGHRRKDFVYPARVQENSPV